MGPDRNPIGLSVGFSPRSLISSAATCFNLGLTTDGVTMRVVASNEELSVLAHRKGND